MAYFYYQTQVSGWGTTQFQFGAPPVPTFHPQPSWRGLDFYNAHAMNPDPGLFDSVMGRIRKLFGSSIGSPTITHQDARHWHKKIYSGLTPLTTLLPADIGAAAAYEAYRTFKHNTFLYEPLSADRERQREGLVGMAIAETQRLWQYSGRTMDTYGLNAACEAAGAAGSMLADRLASYTRSGLARQNSYSSMNDAYTYDDPYRRAGRSRHNSFTALSVVRVGGSSPLMSAASLASPGYPTSAAPIPIPGAAMSAGAYSAGTFGSYGTYGAGISGSYSTYGAGISRSYGTYGASISGSYGTYGAAQPGIPGSYGTAHSAPLDGRISPSPFGVPASAAAGQYTFNGMPVGGYVGSTSVAAAHGGAQGAYTLPYEQGPQPGSAVIATPQPQRSLRPSTPSLHPYRPHSSSRRDGEYEWEREERDWERADHERHERNGRQWETEELVHVVASQQRMQMQRRMCTL